MNQIFFKKHYIWCFIIEISDSLIIESTTYLYEGLFPWSLELGYGVMTFVWCLVPSFSVMPYVCFSGITWAWRWCEDLCMTLVWYLKLVTSVMLYAWLWCDVRAHRCDEMRMHTLGTSIFSQSGINTAKLF